MGRWRRRKEDRSLDYGDATGNTNTLTDVEIHTYTHTHGYSQMHTDSRTHKFTHVL